MSESIVSLRNVDKAMCAASKALRSCRDSPLDIAKGDFVALMGPSGSGKTHAPESDRGLIAPLPANTVAGQRLDARAWRLARWRSASGLSERSAPSMRRNRPLRCPG